MAYPYNLTEIEAANSIPELAKGVNNLVPGWPGNAIIFSLGFIIFISMKSLGIETPVCFFGTSLVMLLSSGLLYFFGMVNVITISIAIALLALSTIGLAITAE